jgi:LPS-assembly lipoprotein
MNIATRIGRIGTVFILPMLLLALSACGFHLRGTYQLPPQLSPLYIDKASMSSPLYLELRAAMKASGVELTTERELAASVFTITRESRSRAVQSVDSSGRAREYDLKYELGFNLKAGEDAIIDNGKLALQRNLLFDPETVLGVANEQESLYQDMIRDGAGLILLRIQAATQ